MLRPTVPSAIPSWSKTPIWGLRPDHYYCWTVAGLLVWGALSDERTGLSFARLKLLRTATANSYKPLDLTCGKTLLIFASLLTRSRDPSPLLRYPSVYSCCLATTVRFGSARHGTEKTPLRLLLCNRGSVFRCYNSYMA
jgi:hypothetical protein